MEWPHPQEWNLWVWSLYALGVVYLVGFFAYVVTIRSAERQARAGDAAAIARYNHLLRGFPRNGYAKMLGKHPLESRKSP